MKISKIKGLRPWQQERHYLQAITLSLLSDYNLVFKGGTYLWFFHGLQRFSEDLDFTSSGRLTSNVAQKVSDGVSIYGMENEVKIMADSQNSFLFRIIANGPLNSGIKDRCVVYVEISKREKAMEDPIPLKLDFPEYTLPIKRILGMDLNEVGSEKIRAILTRTKNRDIFDLYFLISNKGISFKRELVNEKLKYYKEKFSKDVFMREVKSRSQRFKKDMRNLVFVEIPEYEDIIEKMENWIPVDNEL